MTRRKPTSRPGGPRLAAQAKRDGASPDVLAPTQVDSTAARWAPMLAIVVLTCAAFAPAISNGFVTWDDDKYIYANPQINYADGIKSIWFDVRHYSDPKFRPSEERGDIAIQYYPMTLTSFWLEFRFHEWFGGADPNKTVQQNIAVGRMTASSFHAVNLLLHLVNALLLIVLLRALGMSNWIACTAAVVFAVHPLQVASVAWATERKNVLSLAFYLLSMLAYVRLRRSEQYRWYLASIAMFICGLLSKSVVATLPVMLFLTDRLLEKSWSLPRIKASLSRLLPFVLLAVGWTLLTVLVEQKGRDISLVGLERPIVVGATLLFYPFKMLLPVHQSPIYRLWDPNIYQFSWYLPLFVSILAAVVIVAIRRRLDRHLIWALLFYVVTQAPMLGFVNINHFQVSFVADHFFYHGGIGLCIAAAFLLHWIGRRIIPVGNWQKVMTVVVAVLAVGCASRTYAYCKVWKDSDTFWAYTLSINPDCWPAHFNQGLDRWTDAQRAAAEGDTANADRLYAEAIAQFEDAIRLDPAAPAPFLKLIGIYEQRGELDLAMQTAKRGAGRFPYLETFHHKIAQIGLQTGDVATSTRHMLDAIKARKAHARLTGDADAGTTEFKRTDLDSAADLYLRMGQPLAAAKVFQSAANKAKENGQTDEAVGYLVQAAGIFQTEADKLDHANDACAAAELYEKSHAAYEAATKLDADNTLAVDAMTTVATKRDTARQACTPENKSQ